MVWVGGGMGLKQNFRSPILHFNIDYNRNHTQVIVSYGCLGGWRALKQNFRPSTHPHIDYNWNHTQVIVSFQV